MNNCGLLGKLILVPLCGCLPLALTSRLVHAQSTRADWEKAAGGKMSFETGSVKVEGAPVCALDSPIPPTELMQTNIPLDDSDRFTPDGGRFSATNVYLIRLITFAYKISPLEGLYSIERLPKWNRSKRFEIEARGPSYATKDQTRLIVQALLAERFKMTAHWETREAPELGLVLANAKSTGPNLAAEESGSKCEPQSGGRPLGEMLE